MNIQDLARISIEETNDNWDSEIQLSKEKEGCINDCMKCYFYNPETDNCEYKGN